MGFNSGFKGLNLDPHRGRIVNCAVIKKKIHVVCNCPVWCAEDTKPWVIYFEVQGYGIHEGVWPNSLVANTWLGKIP